MIKHLDFTVTFPSTGKVFSGKHTFAEGLTAIGGANEQGKSLRLEMIRFALFGSKALRSTLDKYKALGVNLGFDLKGVSYIVTRTPTTANLTQVGTTGLLAVSTKAVNAKIIELFGYGIDVFDAAHAILQGQVEALGSMKPAERKRMVDSVIGLDVLDSLIAFATEQASAAKIEADTLSNLLVVPTLVAKPDDYHESAMCQTAVDGFRLLKTELDQITGWLSTEKPEPVKPAPCKIQRPVVDLRAQLQAWKDGRHKVALLTAQRDAIPVPSYTTEQLVDMAAQWDDHKKWLAYAKIIAAMPPKPTLSTEDYHLQTDAWVVYTNWEKRKIAFEMHSIACPNCHHTWAEDHAAPGPEPFKPTLTMHELVEQNRRYQLWKGEPEAVPEVAEPAISLKQIGVENTANLKAAERERLFHEIGQVSLALIKTPDCSVELAIREAYETVVSKYDTEHQIWSEFQKVKATKVIRQNELADVPARLQEAEHWLLVSRQYEMAVATYTKDLLKYNDLSVRIDAARETQDGYTKARQAVVKLKALVKSHLVPSLNKVASSFLSQMTNGVRTTIQCDEDFNILVDGQDLDELSGSAKAVANLSIRLGLGQVLTNRVFPVLLGDEIDAAMDDERAGFTAECLRNLTGKIKQILLVSHKQPEADNYIVL